MTQINPFPDYPVVRLKDDAKSVEGKTIDTDAIAASHELLRIYVAQWKAKHDGGPAEIDPLVIRVEGDYGTGKTHLLLDAIALVQTELGTLYPTVNILRVTCVETGPVEWYRGTIGGEVARPFLIDLVVRLYAEAGKDVAAGAELTNAAVLQIESDYKSVYTLIKASFLNLSKVNDRFNELLIEICREAGEDLRKVLSGLVWDATLKMSTRWLAGVQLTQPELDKLRISASLTTENDVIDVLTAIAAIHRYLNFPFGLVVDEVEHWTRYDLSHASESNMTWLKRLLENLATYQSLVIVCGRLEAWRQQGDVVDRFTSYRSIRLERLKPETVELIVRTLLTAAQVTSFSFGPTEAQAVTECTGGSIRRVLSFCGFLFRKSAGFSQRLNEESIRKLAEEAGQRISIEEAKLVIHEFLEKQDLRVMSDESVDNIRFDMVGYNGNQPRVIVELKHARTQHQHVDYLLRFVEQMKEVYSRTPEAFGCFIVDGNIEESVLSREARDLPFKIFWFDLTERDVLSRIAKELGDYLKRPSKVEVGAGHFRGLLNQSEQVELQLTEARRSDNQALIEELQLQRNAIELQVKDLRAQMLTKNTDFEKYLSSLEAQRSAELRALYEKLEKLGDRMNSKQAVNVITGQGEGFDQRLHATYTELTRPLSFSKKIRLAFRGNIVVVGLYLILSIVVIFVGPYFSDVLAVSVRGATLYRIVFTLGGVVSLVGLLLVIWRKLSELDKYTEFGARVLREVYLKVPNPEELVTADNILRDILEDAGPLYGRDKAREVLSRRFPEILGHLDYRSFDRDRSGVPQL